MQNTAAQRDTFDVVIVGAGPTGLLLAAELVIGGASVVVLERLAEPDVTIKAGAMSALAGEALERRGLGPAMAAEEQLMADAIMKMRASSGAPTPAAGALPWRKIGGHFAGLFLIDQSVQREPERRMRGVGQQALERILADYGGVLGVEVRRGREVVGFEEGNDGITVDVSGTPGRETLRCRYLVGCDGGRSFVRKRAGFEFPGTEPTITGHQAIVELDAPEKLLPLGWRRTNAGMFVYGPTPGRVLLAEFDGPPVERDAPVTIEELQRSLRRVTGIDVTVLSVKTATRFTDHARQVTNYRCGRVLLAGDAAHVHSPFGGQGLNLGLLDAVNLGWKLAATIVGTAPEGLLDSYSTERHPVGARVLENTRAQIALMRPDAHTSALREIVMGLMNIEEGNRFFGEMMSGLATRYDLSEGDPSEHALVGRLVGDRPVPSVNEMLATGSGDETRLYGLMMGAPGCGLVVDAGDGEISKTARAWETKVRCVRARAGTSMLIRPDGCIAWANDANATNGLELALARWFGPTTHARRMPEVDESCGPPA